VRTLGEVLAASAGYLEEKGSPTPRLDAELLLAHALGVTRVELYTHHDRPLNEPELAAIRELIRRRARREPVAYITGSKGFRRLELQVDDRVLVPRPETELVVDRALVLLAGAEAPRVLDVGTGSGAIALSVASELPGALVTATDVSDGALEVARSNAERLGIDVEFVHGDLLDGVAGRRFAAILSNPPYITQADLPSADPEVREFEPQLATVAGPDGREIYQRLLGPARDLLEPEGVVVVECGEGQAPWIAGEMERLGYRDVAVHTDLADIERVVEGRLG
jgi:release factor glutamine methyltransferase